MLDLLNPGKKLRRPNWPFSLNRASDRSNGLVTWIPMNSGSKAWNLAPGGGNCYGSGVGGALGWAIGPYGGMAFDDNNSAGTLTLNNAAAVDSSKPSLPASMACWVMLTRTDATAGSSQGIFCNNVFNAGTKIAGIDIITDGTSHWEIDCGDGVGATSSNRRIFVSTAAWSINTWYRVLAVFGANVAPILYVNGVAVAGSASGTGSSVGYDATAGTIGGPTAGWAPAFLGGQAFDCCIWNSALTADAAWADFDPKTRWDLYWQPTTTWFLGTTAAAGAPKFISEQLGFSPMGMH
jgi:hypothetical protein